MSEHIGSEIESNTESNSPNWEILRRTGQFAIQPYTDSEREWWLREVENLERKRIEKQQADTE